jgi:hypothetical protein
VGRHYFLVFFFFISYAERRVFAGHGVPVKTKLISTAVVGVTVIVTVVAGWYVIREMNRVKDEVIYSRRKTR